MFRTALVLVLSVLAPLLSVAQSFVENRGQWAQDFSYKADIPGGAMFLEDDALLFHLIDRSIMHDLHDQKMEYRDGLMVPHHAFRLRFLGCNDEVNTSAKDRVSYYTNYYLGNNPRKWQSSIYPANTVIYHDLYDGIDLHVKRTGQRMKYEFHLEPGVDPKQIRIVAQGLDSIWIDREGQMLMRTSISDILESKPYIYQTRGSKQYEIDGSFVLSGKTISYAIDQLDSTLPLVIDPELIFSTYSGSAADNWGFTATPDKDGFLYSGSISFGTGYPTVIGSFDVSYNGANSDSIDVCITKYNQTGTNLVYSTYLGGRGSELPHSMIVDDDNNLYVYGTTSSNNFPTTGGAFDRSFNGGPARNFTNLNLFFSRGVDMYVTRFNSAGSALLGSTFLGGNSTDGFNDNSALTYNYADHFRGEINLDDNGSVYVVSSTTSTNFPGTSGSFQSSKNDLQDGIIAKLNATLTNLQWASYIGGDDFDAVYGIDIASDQSIYVAGGTSSFNFPSRAGGFQTNYAAGRCDGFISHIQSNGKLITHSTFYGTSAYDQLYLIQLDKDDHPHVFGQTEHPGSNFIFNAGFNNVGGGQVLAHFRPDLSSRVWSTQFGSTSGRPNISPTALLVDVCNSVYLSGWGGTTNSTGGNNNASSVNGLPTTGNALQQNPDNTGSDFYLCVLTADANTLTYGSFYGGAQSAEHVDGGTSRFDRSGKIYQCVCAGCGGRDDFPIEPDPGAWSTTNNSQTPTENCNSAVFKIDFELPIIIADFDGPEFGCAPFTASYVNESVTQTATTFQWISSNGQGSSSTNPTFTFTNAGEYTVQLIVSDPNSCNLNDTIEKSIIIKTDTAYEIPPVEACVGDPVTIGPDGNELDLTNATISWSPTTGLSSATVLNPQATLNDTTEYTLTINYGGCSEVITQQVNVDRFPIGVTGDTIICSDFSPFFVQGTSYGQGQSYAWSDSPKFVNILSTDSVMMVEVLSEPITTFYFRVTKANGCTRTDSISVTQSDLDLYLTNDTGICLNEDFRIEALSENPENTFAYYWTHSFYTDASVPLLTDTFNNFLLINESASRWFHLHASSLKVPDCIVHDSVFITVASLDKSLVRATAEQDTFHYGERVQLHGEPSEPFDYYWTPGRWLDDSLSADPVARAKREMTYTYVVSDPDVPACLNKDSVTITPYEILCDEPEIFLPSAFTPNGDGLNDNLIVRGRNLTEVNFSVYDRWGKLMYHTEKVGEGWNGHYRGGIAEPAVYVYYYEAVCLDGQRVFKKGNVTLSR